jgi:hypothetical protein
MQLCTVHDKAGYKEESIFMSLSSHLEHPDSPIKIFLYEKFHSTKELTIKANKKLKASLPLELRTLRTRDISSKLNIPLLAPCFPSAIYGAIGTALDYRIRYYFNLTPHTSFVAWKGAQILVAEKLYTNRTITKFFTELEALLKSVDPVRRKLSFENEIVLSRFCFILALFEQVFRTPRYIEGELFKYGPRQSFSTLIDLPEKEWVVDIAKLSVLFYENYASLTNEAAILNPTFSGSIDIGGADADLIIDGCLIDIKTTITPVINSVWLRQLAGYLLLDDDDAYHIQSVGVYMARLGELLVWSVEEFLSKLTGSDLSSDVQLPELRTEFKKLCQKEKQLKS